MLTPYKINAYCEELKPEWTCEMPTGCLPEDVLVPSEHPFFRLAIQKDSYTAEDFKSYAKQILNETGEKNFRWQWDYHSLTMCLKLVRI